MLPHFIIHSLLHYLSTGRLREVENRKISNYKNGRGRVRNGTLPQCKHSLKLYKCNINAVEHSGTSVVTGWPCGWSRNRTECSSTTWWMWHLRFNQTLCKEILSMWSCTYFASSFLLRHTPPVLTGLINCFLTFGHFLDKWKKKKIEARDTIWIRELAPYYNLRYN